MFLSVGPFFEEGGEGSRKFQPEAEIFGIYSIEVAPYWLFDSLIINKETKIFELRLIVEDYYFFGC